MSITGPAPKEFSIYDAFANESILYNKRGTLVSLIDPEQTFTDTTLYVMNTSQVVIDDVKCTILHMKDIS